MARNSEHAQIASGGSSALREWRTANPEALLDLRNANLAGVDLSGADLRRANLSEAKLVGAVLTDADLSNASLRRCDMTEADLRGANVDGADFFGAILRQARLIGLCASLRTRFEKTQWSGATLDRYNAEFLELPRSVRLQMTIVDDLARLQGDFSGFWQGVHLAALVVFVAPYGAFVWRRWWESVPAGEGPQDARTITVFESLINYVWSGGRVWEQCQFHWGFWLFAFGIAYNGVRLALLYKTKSLELLEVSTGLPVHFVMSRRWWALYGLSHWGFYANVVIVAAHAVLHLQRTIVLGSK